MVPMSCSPHFSLSVFPSANFLKSAQAQPQAQAHAHPRFHSLSNPDNSETAESLTEGEKSLSPLILVERYSNGSTKRYIFHGESSKETFQVQQKIITDEPHKPDYTTGLTWLPMNIKDFILPAGFPVQAVGAGSFAGSAAAASAAAIRWVSKDGIGAVGRLIIGGRFGRLFDDDPRQWRMYADFIGSAGSIFDLTTQLYPAYFLPLASLGNLSKAVARGLKDPSFRVIQNHFAASGNLGDVAAKEEVWEVTAQLIGLALGILILDTPDLVTSYPALFATWTSMRLFHLWLRFQSLSVLKFETINLKRARILAEAHVLHSKVPDCTDCNREENILTWQRFLKPRIVFGVPADELTGGQRSSFVLKEMFKLYAREKYVLAVDQWQKREFKVLVAFKVCIFQTQLLELILAVEFFLDMDITNQEGATSLSALRSVWQAYWLYENWDNSVDFIKALKESLSNLEARFNDFVELLEEAGWNIRQINLNVPKDPYIEELHS
ncbi:hypothetical protein Cgig2_029798 [Carnegiea gigantea]|uniref:Protein root UVB sensitive 5 n=1 Tax=Carnegiea gigantea TaxID=171969 RepID=A0A9Q1QJT8_9CARY|nr:hypothetical protein Cgig2_029798 [Carnegiea gigantea]